LHWVSHFQNLKFLFERCGGFRCLLRPPYELLSLLEPRTGSTRSIRHRFDGSGIGFCRRSESRGNRGIAEGGAYRAVLLCSNPGVGQNISEVRVDHVERENTADDPGNTIVPYDRILVRIDGMRNLFLSQRLVL